MTIILLGNTSCKQHTVYIIKEAANFLALINFHSIFPLLTFRCKKMILNKTQHLTEYLTIHIISFLFQEETHKCQKICN